MCLVPTRSIVIRPPRPEDQAYISATWARSLMSAARGGHAMRRHGSPRAPAANQRLLGGPSPVSYASYAERLQTLGGRIDAVLDRSDTRALVAVRPGAGPGTRDFIVGWVIYCDAAGLPIVHYAYTRDHAADGRPLRGTGIAGAMFARIGIARTSPVACTSDGPSSEALRGHFRASTYYPLEDFLTPKER